MTAIDETASTSPYAASDLASEREGSRVHPLIHAGRAIAEDLISTFSFAACYALTHSVYVATGLGIATGVAQIAWLGLRRRPIDAMQWMSLGLVLVFGGAALVAHDPRFVMLKPTLIYVAIGAVMLRRDWMIRYMPPLALRWGRDVIMLFSRIWPALMFATAGLNLALVARGDIKTWAWFIGVFPLASKLGLIAAQYLATRAIVRMRMA